MKRIGIAERQARLVARHHIAPPARVASAVDVATDLVALHATDPSSVFLALWARMKKPAITGIEAALYRDRTIWRMLGMRRTMFVVATSLVPVIQAACTDEIAVRERRRLVQLLDGSGVPDPD